jgi:uncharacterized protein YigA (DUF484 family)
MADPHIITALRNKRAELSGDLAQTEARIQRLRTEIGAVDVTLRLFDPGQKPATIKPRVKRAKSSRFKAGEFSRSLLGLIREADRPLTVRDLAEAVAAAHGLDTSSPKAMRTLIANTRSAMSKPREGIVREDVGGVYQWRRAADMSE